MAETHAVSRSTLGLAAEYAVASELCRRNVYAQLTLGNQKRTDLLVFSESGQLARLEVKGKQGGTWPSCRGVSGRRTFLIFTAVMCRIASSCHFLMASLNMPRASSSPPSGAGYSAGTVLGVPNLITAP